jgi:glycine hydroxymethyltransferase
MLVSLISKGITGKAADAALDRAHITVNKNAVPNDPKSPFVTSGIRVGTPAVTTRGFGTSECITLSGWMCDVMDALSEEKMGAQVDVEAMIASIREKVQTLCAQYPVYR